jgi:hypothetical protein
MLPPPACFHIFPSSRLAFLLLQMLAFCDRRCRLADTAQEGNTTDGRQEDVLSAVIPTIPGTSFRGLSTINLTGNEEIPRPTPIRQC